MTKINDKICGMTLDIPSETKEVDTHTITISDILSQDNLDVTIIKYENVYSDIAKTVLDNINKQLEKSADDCTHIVELDICFLKAPVPKGSNYLDIAQNTEVWHNARKLKITGSRLPSLLGIYGKKKFTSYWEMVIDGKNNENLLAGIENIKRGHLYEKEAIRYFETVSKSTTNQWFFSTPIQQ